MIYLDLKALLRGSAGTGGVDTAPGTTLVSKIVGEVPIEDGPGPS